jgi:hypothetical protein
MKAHKERKMLRGCADDDDSLESNASVMDDMEDIACRLKRIQEDILEHYNQNQNSNAE